MSKEILKIVCILDMFSYDCLKYECDLLYLNKSSWKKQIEELQPDLLLVESFWEGIDQSWRAELVNFKNIEDSEIKKLISYCNINNIKTVFWNKEDPPNFGVFIDVAVMFDFIFTTDSHCLKKYAGIVGEKRVFLLPFAAQPLIHNPIGKKFNKRIAFAGSWYEKKHFLRQSEMEYILDGVLAFDNLDIYDRNYHNGTTSFPEKYSKYVRGSLKYDVMVQMYKEYSIFLNANIVFYSETMFSRRVFEILASGTNLVSSYALGIQNFFPNIVPMSSTAEGIQQWTNLLLNDIYLSRTLSVLGIREIYNNHLYEHRMNYLLECIGEMPLKETKKHILIVTLLNNIKNIDVILENFRRQNYPNKKLVIICRESTDLSKFIKIDYTKYSDIPTFLNCLKGDEIIAIMSEVSYYGPEYLTDYIHATKYTRAPIIGKSHYYRFSNTSKCVAYGIENNYVDFSQINLNTLFIRLDGVGKEIILNIFEGEEVDFPPNYCYSINMNEFANMYILTDCIHDYINVDEIQLKQPNIGVEKYKQQLLSNSFSKDYIGFNNILQNEVALLGAPIVIYASGEHTEKVLKIINRNQFNIIGLTDSNEALFGTYKFGLLIESLDFWLKKGMKYIYISSKEYEEEIFSNLKNNSLIKNINIINLYKLSGKYKEDLFREIYLDDIYY